MHLTHHAYYIEGSLSLFDEYVEALKPLWARTYDRFGIEEARELIRLASLKRSGQNIFFVGTSSLTSEAQQALLKLFEEPSRGSVFILLLPHGSLIGTLRSRMLPYEGELTTVGDRTLAKKFLASSVQARSATIATLIKDEEGARERARELLLGLEGELVKKIKDPTAREGLTDIAKVRDYLRDRSPSLKMLLEHLALSLPKI